MSGSRCGVTTRRSAAARRSRRAIMDLGFAVLLTFFILFVLGFPVVFAILIPSIAYIAWEAIPLATVAQRVLYALDSFPLVAVPVFIFVGNLMNAAGITEKIYHFANRSEEHTSELQSQSNLVCRLLLEKKKKIKKQNKSLTTKRNYNV